MSTSQSGDPLSNPIHARATCGRSVKSRDGAPCKNSPIGGVAGKPCRVHGGAAPQVRNAAAREKAEGEVRKTAAMLMRNSQPIADPLTALQELAGEALSWKNAVAEQVDILKLGYSSDLGIEQIKAAVQLYERALDRLNTILAGIARLNIDDRLIAIQAGQKEMILRAIQAALSSAGVTGPAATSAIVVAGRELRAVVGARANAGYN